MGDKVQIVVTNLTGVQIEIPEPVNRMLGPHKETEPIECDVREVDTYSDFYWTARRTKTYTYRFVSGPIPEPPTPPAPPVGRVPGTIEVRHGGLLVGDSVGILNLLGTGIQAMDLDLDTPGQVNVTVTAGGGGGGTGGSGWLNIVDVVPTGTGAVGDKVYQDPAHTILQECRSFTASVSVMVKASAPLVTIGGVTTALSLSLDGGHYSGAVPIVLLATGDVKAILTLPDGVQGAEDTVHITLDTPPVITDLRFNGGYPGTQTELKANDTFHIIGTTDKPITQIQILDFGACNAQTFTIPASTSFDVTVVIADRGTSLQRLPARVQVTNSSGSTSAAVDTNADGGTVEGVNLVSLNNLYPTVTFGAKTYPPGQAALKDTEQAIVNMTIANLNSMTFSSNGELTISAPTTVAQTVTTPTAFSKQVNRASGNYNISSPNFQVQAVRTANNAITTQSTVVAIAHVAAQLSISLPATRLRSGGFDGTAEQFHTITLQSNQVLANAPTMEGTGGTFINSWSASGATNYVRTLRVRDLDPKGTFNWVGLVATNLAGKITGVLTGSSQYVLGGFVPRSFTFGAFSKQVTMNVPVTDYSKLRAGIFTATNQPATRTTTQGDQTNQANKFTVLAVGTSPVTVWWNDVNAANSNSSGTAQITQVEETV